MIGTQRADSGLNWSSDVPRVDLICLIHREWKCYGEVVHLHVVKEKIVANIMQ